MSDRNSCNATRNPNAMRLNGKRTKRSSRRFHFVSMNEFSSRPTSDLRRNVTNGSFTFRCRRHTDRLRFKYISTFYWPIAGSVWCAPHAANRKTTAADQTNYTSRFYSHRLMHVWDPQCARIVTISFPFSIAAIKFDEMPAFASISSRLFVSLHGNRLYFYCPHSSWLIRVRAAYAIRNSNDQIY